MLYMYHVQYGLVNAIRGILALNFVGIRKIGERFQMEEKVLERNKHCP